MDFIVGLLAIAMICGVGYFIYTKITRERPALVPVDPEENEATEKQFREILARMAAKEMPTVTRHTTDERPDETKD